MSVYLKSTCCDAPIVTNDEWLHSFAYARHLIACTGCGSLIDYYDDECYAGVAS